VKRATLPKAVCRFPIKTPMSFFTEIEKSILKLIWKHKRPKIATAILSKKSNAEGNPNYTWLQTILYSYSNKKVHGTSKKPDTIDQWNRIEDHKYPHTTTAI
jgi:hypothetical protein